MRTGRLAVYTGIAMTTTGLVVGFTAMFMGKQEMAINWLTLVPFGFVVMLAGTVAAQLGKRSDDEN